MMTNLAREELATRVRALDVEEREVVIDNLPLEELLEGIKRAYNNMCIKCERIHQFLEN